MMLIPCPYCGSRNENEFAWGGEVCRVRPESPGSLSDTEWADYLYNSDNKKGVVKEYWWHVKGCKQWFEIERDNSTHAIMSPGQDS
jgi:sarcosine oxidase subunit delta